MGPCSIVVGPPHLRTRCYVGSSAAAEGDTRSGLRVEVCGRQG